MNWWPCLAFWWFSKNKTLFATRYHGFNHVMMNTSSCKFNFRPIRFWISGNQCTIQAKPDLIISNGLWNILFSSLRQVKWQFKLLFSLPLSLNKLQIQMKFHSYNFKLKWQKSQNIGQYFILLIYSWITFPKPMKMKRVSYPASGLSSHVVLFIRGQGGFFASWNKVFGNCMKWIDLKNLNVLATGVVGGGGGAFLPNFQESLFSA